MTLHEFQDAARVLWSTDHHEVPWMSEARWDLFCRAPVRFLLQCDDRTADMIWQVVEARRATSGRMRQAADDAEGRT